VRTGYGFRHYPYQDRTRLTLGFGSKTGRAYVEGDTEFPIHRQAILGHIRALATGALVHRYYGLGNETVSEGHIDTYKAFGMEYLLGVSALFRFSNAVNLEAGILYSLSDPDENLGTVLAQEAPYGFQGFQSLSFTGAIRWEGRDNVAWPMHGGTFELSGSFYPEMGDVVSRFGKAKASATGYLTAEDWPLRPTLALRAGGAKIWGDFPYQEAAILGGSQGLRGFPEERFRGDASLFGGAELRLRFGALPTLLPGSWGLTGSTESGRVWLAGEDSDRWHGTYGGGLWVSIIDTFTLTMSVARSDEGTRFLYGGGGFSF
jgi:hypothetical protein